MEVEATSDARPGVMASHDKRLRGESSLPQILEVATHTWRRAMISPADSELAEKEQMCLWRWNQQKLALAKAGNLKSASSWAPRHEIGLSQPPTLHCWYAASGFCM